MATARAPGGVLVDPATGIVQASISAAIAGQVGDFPLAADGTLCASTESSQSRVYRNGLAYDSTGRLIVDSSASPAAFVHGIGISAAGAICVDTSSSAAAFLRGLGFAGAGKMCMTGLIGPNLLPTPNGPYTSGSWGGSQVTETTGQTDPLGGTTASLLTDNAVAAQHFVSPGSVFAVTSGASYRMSAYLKASTWTGVVCLQFGTQVQGNFDLTAHSGSNGGLPVTATNFQATSVGNGYFLYSYDFVSNATQSAQWYCGFSANLGTYAGSGQSYFLWGAALQAL